jgi:hypothetical protein
VLVQPPPGRNRPLQINSRRWAATSPTSVRGLRKRDAATTPPRPSRISPHCRMSLASASAIGLAASTKWSGSVLGDAAQAQAILSGWHLRACGAGQDSAASKIVFIMNPPAAAPSPRAGRESPPCRPGAPAAPRVEQQPATRRTESPMRAAEEPGGEAAQALGIALHEVAEELPAHP